jgi:hypothetical protein
MSVKPRWQTQALHCIQREMLAQHRFSVAKYAMNNSRLRLSLLVYRDVVFKSLSLQAQTALVFEVTRNG